MTPKPTAFYQARKGMYLGCLLLFLFFLGLCIWIVNTPEEKSGDHLRAILGIILFSGLSLLMVRQLLPGRASIETSPEGLTIRSAFQTQTYRWSDIENFGVSQFTIQAKNVYWGGKTQILKGHVPGGRHFERVGFNFSRLYPGGGLAWRFKDYNQAHYGFDGLLPDNYREDCAQLAEHLDQLKAQATGNEAK